MKIAREMLIEEYLDYFNNYLSIDGFAEANGLELIEARQLIDLARMVCNHNHPEA